MPYDILSQKDLIYGRAPDLAHLRQRAENNGLTVVLGRPQQGKTWLLQELARTLDDSGQVAVGFGRSYGESADLMLRAVQDLYARWLTRAGVWGRVKAAGDAPASWLAGPVKLVLDHLVKAVAGDNALTESMVRQALDALIMANKEATGAAGFLPTLKYDQARDLVAAVHRLSGHRVVLVMDQYQESPDPEGEAKTLRAFLADCDTWPPCHILLALREQEAAADVMRVLVKERPGRGALHALGGMALDDDTETRRRMLAEIRDRLPALTEVDDAAILDWVEDYPGVLYRWRDMEADDAPALIQDRAKDAHAGRYPEIERVLETLEGDDLSLAIRLALYPNVENADHWEALRDALLDGLDPCGLDRLARARLIEGITPPTFGHARRRKIARGWVLQHAAMATGQAIEVTVKRLAGPIKDATPNIEPHARALAGLAPVLEARGAPLPLVVRACVQAAHTLFQGRAPAGGALDGVVGPSEGAVSSWAAALAAELGSPILTGGIASYSLLGACVFALAPTSEDAVPSWATSLLAMGLVNTLQHAKDEGDRPRRDALLAGLRALTAVLTPLMPHVSDGLRALIREELGL